MTAAANIRNTPELDDGFVKTFDLPAKGGIVLYAGTIAVSDAAGYGNVPSAVTDKAVGRVEETVDTTGLADGVGRVKIKRGCFPFFNSAAGDAITIADRFKTVYLVDNQTVAKTDGTGTRAPAGVVYDVDASGVWVALGMTF